MRLLIRALKVLGWGIAIIVLVPLLGFLYYDLTEFQPRKDDIAELIARAPPGERTPSAMLRHLLITEDRGDISLTTSRLLTYRLDVYPEGQRTLERKRTDYLWWRLVRLHLSEEEQLAIICSSIFLGRRAYGFEAAANAYFRRSLDELSEAELATLVVLARRPSR